MVDLSRPWPLWLGTSRWWGTALLAVAVVAIAFSYDRAILSWAYGLPAEYRDAFAQLTPYGESDWILWPSGVALAVTALVALFTRWRLMRMMLWQFVSLYAFVFVGVGLPSLATAVVKRIIGRARPGDADSTFILHPNLTDWTQQSLPSGHATTAFALAMVIGFLAPRWLLVSVVLAAAIAFSRLTLDVHYPSDVTVGAIVGVLGAYGVRWFFARRGWMFRFTADGSIEPRPLSSVRRYTRLKRRRSAQAPA